MSEYRILLSAERRIEDIYGYDAEIWGAVQAERYVRGLYKTFEAIAERRIAGRAIPRGFGLDGFYCRYERHYIYWRLLSDGMIGIVTILHERMHQIDRFRDDAP